MLVHSAKRKVCFRFLVSLLLAAPPLVTAHPPQNSARQQINAKVVEEGRKSDCGAGTAHWLARLPLHLNVFMPSNVAALPACSQPLRLSSAPLQQKNLARQNYRVACGSGASWQAVVTVKAGSLPADSNGSQRD
ncbi:Flagellar basal-body P-ring formation protein [Pseudescherichia vulneris]|nr:hypothetical protein [Pseudescherichia vulneris]STQ58820.1 Flagellar basal-body P-ring formation protein [Pseudescherichia vulneris]